MKPNFPLFLAVLAALLTTGCGGGGGGTAAAQLAAPAAAPPASGQSVGTVTGFGSIFVNGIEFDTRQATFVRNGRGAVEHDLKVGQVVTVSGTRNADGRHGTATQVTMRSNVEGTVTALDATAGQITVLGQIVQLDANTVVEGVTPADIPADINGLAVGDAVEVSGLPGGSGVILATHIEKLSTTPATLQLRGVVASLDGTAKTFSIGAQVIDYANATLSDFAATALANGDKVEVQGPPPAAGAALAATRVEREERRVAGARGDHSEVEGLVTRFVSATDFDIASQQVTTTDATRFERGSAADLKLGARVEAEGTVDAAGVLVARKIEVRAAGTARVAGRIDALDSAAQTLTVLGQLIAVDANTQYEDDSAAHKMPFGFADLSANDFVVVRAVPGAGTGNALATRVERRDATQQTRLEVRGKVVTIAKPTFVVTGVTVTVDGGTRLELRHRVLTLDEFFAQLAVGQQLEVHGVATGAKAITATAVDSD